MNGGIEGHDDKVPQEPSLPDAARAIASEADRGTLNKIRRWINGHVAESVFPSKEGNGYESTMGIYGGKLVRDAEGKLVYDVRGFWSRIDQWGDRILRAFDDHHVRNPWKMLLRRPWAFYKLLPFFVDSKRYRGTPAQTMENVQRLGLAHMYEAHPWGIAIKDPDKFSHSVGLQDIFRSDMVESDTLKNIDRFKAATEAARYLGTLHTHMWGGVAEANAYSFLFGDHKEGAVTQPYIMIPTEIYNPAKKIGENEKQATDLLDFLSSCTFEEIRRSGDWRSVDRLIDTVLDAYGRGETIELVASLVRRGRLTLPSDMEALSFKTSRGYRALRPVAALHNTQRLTALPRMSADVRRHIQVRCEQYYRSRSVPK